MPRIPRTCSSSARASRRHADRLGRHEAIDSWRETLAIAERHDGVVAALGVHPHEAADGDVAALRDALQHPKAVAVGETGLDYFRDYAPRDAQRRIFDEQLELAAELGKPVVIHTRAADEDTLAALAGFDGTVVLHCFSSLPLLEPALERGWYVSFAGNVTYKNAHDLRSAAYAVPAERLLAETDSPVPRAGAAPRPAERARERRPHASPRSRTRATPTRTSSPRRSRRTRALLRSVSTRAEEGARPALSRRREHPARDRAARRALDRRRRARDRSRPRHPHALPRRARRARARGRDRPLARGRPADAPRTSSCTGATRSRSTSPRSSRSRASSSRTCRTTSRRRSSSRASTGCRASSGGA